MRLLLDANVLISLTDPDHVHHDRAASWFAEADPQFATSPLTQGALVRMKLRVGRSVSSAQELLRQLVQDPRHEFWPDVPSYDEVRMEGVVGHRQVTDAYLAQLTRHHGGKLATFDSGLAALHEDVAFLVP